MQQPQGVSFNWVFLSENLQGYVALMKHIRLFSMIIKTNKYAYNSKKEYANYSMIRISINLNDFRGSTDHSATILANEPFLKAIGDFVLPNSNTNSMHS